MFPFEIIQFIPCTANTTYLLQIKNSAELTKKTSYQGQRRLLGMPIIKNSVSEIYCVTTLVYTSTAMANIPPPPPPPPPPSFFFQVSNPDYLIESLKGIHTCFDISILRRSYDTRILQNKHGPLYSTFRLCFRKILERFGILLHLLDRHIGHSAIHLSVVRKYIIYNIHKLYLYAA